jgi:hypothetical protein
MKVVGNFKVVTSTEDEKKCESKLHTKERREGY